MAEKTAAEIWAEAIESVEQNLGQADMLLRQSKGESLADGTLTVIVPNPWAKNHIEGEYIKQIHNVLRNKTGVDTEIDFIVREDDWTTKGGAGAKTGARIPSRTSTNASTLNHKYTFDSFVVGPSNRFSYTASLAVAESPAKVYNPLYIYGNVGLGKTHLMHAIGNSVKAMNNNLKILYTSSEEFTNAMIESLWRGTPKRGTPMPEFRNKYRTVDVLLIDDIQFIHGKDGTQEEFFHTFNALHNAQKQIVLTSDRPPRDIASLEERLRSRFEWGLITVIETPDVETRIAILRKKNEELGKSRIPDDVAMFIADRVTTNIRELEGCLLRAWARADLDDVSLSIDLVRETLKDIISQNLEEYAELVTAESIQKVVAKHFGIRMSELRSKKRTKLLTLPRHVAMYICRRLTKLSLMDVGLSFGRKDHSTVLHACNKIEENIKSDSGFAKSIEQIIEEVKNTQT